MSRRPPLGLETKLVRACLDFLALKKIFAWRANSGGMKAEYKGKERYIPFSGAKGQSDILGILPGGRFLAIECKIGKRKTTEQQRDFLRRIERAGGMALVVYSLDDLMKALQPPKRDEVARCSEERN